VVTLVEYPGEEAPDLFVAARYSAPVVRGPEFAVRLADGRRLTL
jgi:hypothetical protein